MNDCPAAKSSATEASGAPFATPANPSLAKSSRKTRLKSTESEGMLTVSLPVDGSAYSDPSFFKEVTEVLLLLADRKRLTDIGPIQSVEWSLAYIYQVRKKFCFCFLEFF